MNKLKGEKMKHIIYDIDEFATEHVLPAVRKELEQYGDMHNACLCLTGFNPNGKPSFTSFNPEPDMTPSYYYQKVNELSRLLPAIKVLSVADAVSPDGRKAILIKLILPDGSVEWTMTQKYKRNGKQFAWDQPKKFDGGFQNFLPAWDSLVNAN
jgi:hypothetical protein